MEYVEEVVTCERVLAPESGSVPLQPPDAVQLVAFVEVHVSDTESPDAIAAGDAEIDAVGAAGGGGAAATVSEADWVILPPEPVQVSEKTVELARLASVSAPETGFDPDHPPDAVQPDAFVEVHVSPALSPVAMLLFAKENVRVGAAGGGGTVTGGVVGGVVGGAGGVVIGSTVLFPPCTAALTLGGAAPDSGPVVCIYMDARECPAGPLHTTW